MIRGDLRFHEVEICIRELEPVRMEAQGGPHRLAVGRGELQRARVRLLVAADGDRAPDPVFARPGQSAAHVLVGGIVEMAVTINDHAWAPATVILPTRTVGAEVRSRKTRSLPTPSMARNISRRLPAMVISSTG